MAITVNAIGSEIEKLLASPLTYSTAEKLCTLYKLKKYVGEAEGNYRSFPVIIDGESSEFAKALSKCKVEEVVEILEEHMDWLEETHPKAHAHIMKMLEEGGR